MISILKNALEMERLEKLRKTVVDCYGQALASTQENLIELDEQQASKFRQELQELGSQVSEAVIPEQLQTIQDLFRGELRSYKENAHEKIRQLRREVEAAASALEEFAGSAAAGGGDHERELKRALQRLQAASDSEIIEEIQEAIRLASASILTSYEQMRSKNQIAVAQLKDEIRLLHQKIQIGRRSTLLEPVREDWNRQDIENRIDDLLSQNTSFCLVVVVLRNLKALVGRHTRAVVEDGLQSLLARSRGIVDGHSPLGRWADNQLVAILQVQPGSAMAISREVAQKLGEPYSFQERGAPRTLVFQVAAGMVDQRAGADVLKFRGRLQKLLATLGGEAQ